MSKVVVVFESAELGQKDYDAIIDELKAQGKLYTEHRPTHVSFNKGDKWCVVDVWNSEEILNEFVQSTLLPIFSKLSLTPPQSSVYPLHNYIGATADELVSA